MDIIHGLSNLEIETTHSSSQEKQEEVKRNWVELPPDVMSLIFLKLGTNDILCSAQWVCTSWWKLSKQPHLFRSIRVDEVLNLFGRSFSPYSNLRLSEGMAIEAIDRSCGELVEFSVSCIDTDELLHYMSEKSRSLKSLRFVTCYEVSGFVMIEVAKKLSQLEDLEIIHCSYFSKYVFEIFGRFCPRLKSCRFNYVKNMAGLNGVALVIAKNMPELRHLNLFGSILKDNDLRAVLDGCPHLESLDLRQCYGFKFAGDLKEMCGNIKVLRLPNDPTDDYEYELDSLVRIPNDPTDAYEYELDSLVRLPNDPTDDYEYEVDILEWYAYKYCRYDFYDEYEPYF